MAYEQIYEYLRDKIVRVCDTHPNANWGARLLSKLMEIDDLDDYLIEAIETIQMYFHTDNVDNPAGQTKLSMVSMTLGEQILNRCSETGKHKPIIKAKGVEGDDKQLMVDQIRTGDLILEPFVMFGYLELEEIFEKNKKGKMVSEGYILRITPRWVEMFRVNRKKLANLSHTDVKPYNEAYGCQIKGEGSRRSYNRPWRRAATKLMSTPWKLNTTLLKAVVDNKRRFVSDVPIDIPINPDGKPDPYLELQEQRRVSKLVDFEIIEEKASKIGDKVFYQEIEADYRGRLYHKEAFFNFQGSDFARSLFLFAEGKEVTREGMWWMAVHTANSCNESYDIDKIPEWCEGDYRSYLESQGLTSISVDKFTLEDRVRWTNENMERIITSGRKREFWREAEKPINLLACCIEWYNLNEHGEGYISHLPISIDGSNNGWQHLGAISKDERTGELVGLVATEIPRDFYVKTAQELLKIDDPILNAMPMKHVRKGISKRGSMTRAYSAGAEKIGKNMWFDCQSAEFDKLYGITEEDCMVWSKDLIKAIDIVCPGPLQTMKYMQELIVYHLGTFKKYKDGVLADKEYSEIRKEMSIIWDKGRKNWTDEETERYRDLQDSCKDYVSVLVEGNGEKTASWTTASGFPVKYEAYKTDKFRCQGRMNGRQIKHVLLVHTAYPDIHRFMCGISPNYIHAQDAAHMALTIDKWEGAFGAVHDSFSTHANDVEDLLALTKNVFVGMYDVDNYFDKIQQNITGGTDTIPKPKQGSLEIQEVYTSDYFFA